MKRFQTRTALAIPTTAAFSRVAPAGPSEPRTLTALLKHARWSLSFAAFLVYIVVITTYRLPLGTAAMATALVTLPLEGKGFRVSPVVGWAAALFGWAALGIATSDYQSAVASNLLEFAKVCAVVLVAVNVVTTRTRLRLFLIVLLGCFALYPVRGALISFFVYGGGMLPGRASWNYIYSNPNDLAAFCLLQFSLAAGVFVSEQQRWARLAAGIGMIILPVLIVLTGSRGGFIALVVLAIVAFRKQIAKFKWLIAIGVVAALAYVVVPDVVWNRLGTIREADQINTASQKDAESSTAQRVEIWKVASTIAIEHPLTGVGLGAYPDAHFEYAQRPQFDPIAFGHRDAHSTYLRLAAELGFVGLILFLGLVGSTIADAERTRRAAIRTHPRLAAQLFYMEAGLFAYLVAGIWGSLGTLVVTYVHLALIHVTSRLLKATLAYESPRNGATAPGTVRRLRRVVSAAHGPA